MLEFDELAAAGAAVLFSSHQLDLVEDLCEDVVIVDQGRIVLAGELEELRAAMPHRFVEIRYQGPSPDWSGLGPAEIVETKDGRIRLRVDRDIDLPAVLAAVGETTHVTSFAYEPPALSELFRQAVAP